MTPDDWNMGNVSWGLKAAVYTLFAVFGGIMGYLMRSLDNNQNKINWSRALIEGASAGFVGLLVTLLCDAIHLSESWTGVIVGVSGWLGANATIRMLESVVLNKLGIQRPEYIESKEKSDADDISD